MKMVVDARQQYFPAFADLATQISHDLRSPLMAICSYAECLAWLSDLDVQTREKYARSIMCEAHRLGRMASDFLVLAAPQSQGELRELSLAEALEQVLDDLSEMLALLEIEVRAELPTPAPAVYWDRQVLRQLLVAALETMIASVGSGGRVVVSCERQTHDLAVSFLAQSDGASPCNPAALSFRAAARLLGTRGGSLLLLDGPGPHLQLQVPYSGALSMDLSAASLERSA